MLRVGGLARSAAELCRHRAEPATRSLTPRSSLLTQPSRFSSAPHARRFSETAAPIAEARASEGVARARLASKVLVSALAVTAGFFGGCGVLGAYSINKRRPRWFSDRFVLSPESLRMPYRSVELETEDGVTLEGWFIEQTVKGRPSDRLVLLCNPYNHDKSTMLAVARGLWETGHSVLLFDFRSFAPRPVSRETIGHLELLDGKAALKWLRKSKPTPSSRIGIVGCSMGGAVALSLAAEENQGYEDIVGVATDCAFANLRDVVRAYIAHRVPGSLPSWFIETIVTSLGLCNKLIYGYELEEVGPASRLSRLSVPMLVLHSGADSIVPRQQADIIYNGAATEKAYKRVVIVPDVEHIGSFFQDEQAYLRRFLAFMDSCFEARDQTERQKRLAELEAAAAQVKPLKEDPRDRIPL